MPKKSDISIQKIIESIILDKQNKMAEKKNTFN